jgi:hypothetical protein
MKCIIFGACGGIGSLESILGLLKSLKIRVLFPNSIPEFLRSSQLQVLLCWNFITIYDS